MSSVEFTKERNKINTQEPTTQHKQQNIAQGVEAPVCPSLTRSLCLLLWLQDAMILNFVFIIVLQGE